MRGNMRIAVTNDVDAINRIYAACARRIAHDDYRPAWEPNTAYVGVVDSDGMLHGFFHVRQRTSLDVELHVCLLPTAIAWMHVLGAEVLAFIFERTTCARITAPFLANVVSAQNYALKHGFVKEGVSRDACRQDGELINVVWYGLTRRDWENRTCHSSVTL